MSMRGNACEVPAPGWDSHVHVFDARAPVAPGHYIPVHRPLVDIEALAQASGFGHLVLVQPSVYGTDNTVLLDALRVSPGRHRGVVVLDPTVSDAALQDMHALGVRGVRFNLVSPVGNGGQGSVQQQLPQRFHALAPRLQALGWPVQWYAHPDDLPAIASLHAEGPAGLVAVLDHLAGLYAGLSPHHPAWQALAKLAGLDAWVKLSGWYRLQAAAPYGALDDAIRRVAARFDNRMVWGSDWPHTSFAPDALPGYATTWAPVARVLSAAKKDHAWCQAAALLYA
jgi:predicted TIM-barrel fold metal-dependent hydrolase